MGLLNEPSFLDILGILAVIAVPIISYFKWRYTYWDKRNLPYLEPCLIVGTMENPFRRTKSVGFWIKGNYDDLKAQGHKHGGLYNFALPVYLPVDPEYVKNVMQKDFQYFTDRGVFYNEKDDPLSAHLFAIGGQKWRNLRTKLTPTFTSGKMKMMFDFLIQCSIPMKELVSEHAKNNQEIDIKEIVACFTTDIIGSCAFGLDCNSFKSGEGEFRKYGKQIFQRSKLMQVASLLFISRPNLGRFLKMRQLPKETTDFFLKVIKDTVSYRETNKVVRKDMLQILIDLKNNKSDTEVDKHDGTALTIEEVAAQAMVFFIAGFETSSTTMTYCLFELASNKDIQQKVRDEINSVLAKHNNKITYEAISDMHYMTQVIEETLRKYPPVPHVTRKCVKNYQVPNTDVVIEEGTSVFISVLGLHRDPEFYPDPEKFDPDRFSNENKKNIHPFTYMPFGEGPRICIGLRFGMMQTKVGLTVLLKNFVFSVNRNTKVPLEIDPYKVVYTTKGTIWLDAKKVA
ncbi:hypothetical protein ILUMI_11069 [Ignelater luminosus]|uniref:Cytochrome P450 n=1 Tax=Ignelater luminosus TaxID=2038154 RepID=A0A8K0GAV2_IGNLU|nr:hypothetical protein ILUMI_11069 [Ignelater luminosus]